MLQAEFSVSVVGGVEGTIALWTTCVPGLGARYCQVSAVVLKSAAVNLPSPL